MGYDLCASHTHNSWLSEQIFLSTSSHQQQQRLMQELESHPTTHPRFLYCACQSSFEKETISLFKLLRIFFLLHKNCWSTFVAGGSTLDLREQKTCWSTAKIGHLQRGIVFFSLSKNTLYTMEANKSLAAVYSKRLFIIWTDSSSPLIFLFSNIHIYFSTTTHESPVEALIVDQVVVTLTDEPADRWSYGRPPGTPSVHHSQIINTRDIFHINTSMFQVNREHTHTVIQQRQLTKWLKTYWRWSFRCE